MADDLTEEKNTPKKCDVIDEKTALWWRGVCLG
jgi:hypothetical protein